MVEESDLFGPITELGLAQKRLEGSMSDNTPIYTLDKKTDHAARVLLVGSALSVGQLHRAVSGLTPPLSIVGCVVPITESDAGDSAEALPVPVLGGLDELNQVIAGHRPIDRVLISLPMAMRQETQRLGRSLDQAGVAWRFMPTLADQLAGRLGAVAMGGGGIDTNELIDRRPRPLDERAIKQTLAGRCVLITGGGGSIGSELARLVGRFEPSKLVLVERSENALFEIDREIARVYPSLPRAAVLHDVTNVSRTLGMVTAYKPDVIFHAAAHKHVPMMEGHPAQAVENNFYGTRSIADAAAAAGVDRFVMISSDKAVNPSSIMGATKRLAELYIQYVNMRSDCRFSMVRFGNVLASACSVLPIWGKQLTQGGPITVTHPRMSRYFMTIPEAAGLVLQSGALANGGEVFLLDMGQPVRILDLAKRFIRSHGLEPDVDVSIKITGVRPGEKLFEELAYDSEDMTPTAHESVRIWQTHGADTARMQAIIQAFDRLRAKGGAGQPWQAVGSDAIVAALRNAVPEMVHAAAG